MPSQQHTRLGQLLIDKGLISAAQLDAAIALQLTRRQRLGEILLEQGLLTEQQLARALKKQGNLRLAAVLMAALLGPVQTASAELSRPPRGLQPLSDLQMREVSARGLDQALQSLFGQSGSADGLSLPAQLATLLPVLSQLDADTSLHAVHYDTERLTTRLNPDGSIDLRLPSSIGELHLDNIRVTGAAPGQRLGSLRLQDIDLSQVSLRIRARP